MKAIFKNPVEIFKYCVICVAAFSFDLCIIFILVQIFSVDYLVAVIVGFIIAVFMNYYLNRRWTFSHTNVSFWKGLAKTEASWLLVLTAVTLIVYILVEGMSINYLLARIIAAIVTAFFGYILDSRWSFNA